MATKNPDQAATTFTIGMPWSRRRQPYNFYLVRATCAKRPFPEQMLSKETSRASINIHIDHGVIHCLDGP